MKTFNRPLESDSFSTQEREKKFNRRTDKAHSGSRSSHSKSQSKSLSKFYVKNLKTAPKKQQIQEFLSKNIKGVANWSPPRRQSTPAKTQIQKKMTLTKQQLLASHEKQIENLKNQISKYRAYIYNQSQTLYRANEENKVMKQEITTLKKIISQQQNNSIVLQKKISQLSQNLSHKQIMLEYWQKEQPAIKKVKTSIFQARMLQYERQKQQLNNKIADLQGIIENLRGNSLMSAISAKQFSISQNGNILDAERSMFIQDDRLHKVEVQLYRAKEEIKRLQISESCTKRKCYKELQNYKLKKEKEYEELKKKFGEFLNKYKITMKKFARFQIKNAISAHANQQLSSGNLQSYVSFTLSEDQQHS